MDEATINTQGLSVDKRQAVEWVFRLILLAAVLWIRGNFISREEFEGFKREQADIFSRQGVVLQDIKGTLIRIEERGKTEERRDQMLSDMEHRVRDLELSRITEPLRKNLVK